MKKSLLVLFILIISIAISLYLLCKTPSHLTHNSPVNANVLVVEGWMPHYGLYDAFVEFRKGDYDYLMITGNAFTGNITMYINSYLVFYPLDSVVAEEDVRQHLFEMDISGTIGPRDSAHFVFWINDQRITEHYTPEQKGRFIVEWNGRLSNIDSLMIHYTNDMVGELGDRILSVNKFEMNGKNLIIEYADLYLDRGRPFGRYRWNVTATSYAELAAHFFVDRGIDRSKVIPVTNYYHNLRRTYGNALSLKQWLAQNDYNISGINVVSMDYHYWRTWLTYQKQLSQKTEMGIISSENIPTQYS